MCAHVSVVGENVQQMNGQQHPCGSMSYVPHLDPSAAAHDTANDSVTSVKSLPVSVTISVTVNTVENKDEF